MQCSFRRGEGWGSSTMPSDEYRMDTYFGHRHVSDKTLADGGMRVGIIIGPNLLSVMTSPVVTTINLRQAQVKNH